jgi:hypothetical protein
LHHDRADGTNLTVTRPQINAYFRPHGSEQ